MAPGPMPDVTGCSAHVPVVGWAGRHFYTRAWTAFRHHAQT